MSDDIKEFDEILDEFTEETESEEVETTPNELTEETESEEVETTPNETLEIKEEPEVKKPTPKKTTSKKTVFKITNKTFQPLQLVINESEMMLLGARRKDNVVYVKQLTNQINNLQKKGLVKIRKMN